MGYSKHEHALVETSCVGDGTRISAFAHVMAGARIGRDCRILGHTFIEDDVVLGDRVTVQSGVQLCGGITVEDDVFIGPNATFTSDTFPGSSGRPGQLARTIIRKGASIGANATILPALVIGESSVIAAGAVVTHNVPRNAVVVGNPARITGYAGMSGQPAFETPPAHQAGSYPAEVNGVVLHRLPLIDDIRGLLSFGEFERNIPFQVKRYFLVFGVTGEHIRGEHAHKTLHQFLVCVHGRCNVVADDGKHRQEFILDSPSTGIYIPPMVWAMQYKYSADAVLLVLASDFYDPDDYVRDYKQFLALCAEGECAPAA